MPIELCNKYQENEISPILDKKLNLKLKLIFKASVVSKIRKMKYISYPEYLSLIKILTNANKVIKK